MKKKLRIYILTSLAFLQKTSPQLSEKMLKFLSNFHLFFYKQYLFYIKEDSSKLSLVVLKELESGFFDKVINISSLTPLVAKVIIEHNFTSKFEHYAFKSLKEGKLHLYPHLCTFASKLPDPNLLKKLIKYFHVYKTIELDNDSPSYKLVKAHNQQYSFSPPSILGKTTAKKTYSLKLNDEYIYDLENVVIAPGFCVLKDGKYLIADKSAHPKHEEVSGLYGIITGGKNSKYVLGTFNNEVSKTIDKGILIAGRNSMNFFHWIIEYLPRLKTISSINIEEGFKIIIPENLPSQLYQALECLNPKYPVLKIKQEESVQVKKLIIPSFHTYIPDRYDIPFWKTSLLSFSHMNYIKEAILNSYNNKEWHMTPKKIYLSRKSGLARQITNNNKVERLFKSKGFKIIYPENYSFLEQVNLFRNAEYIAGPGGAALTNIIFCKPNTKILGLISEQNKEFCLHSNLADFAGCDFKYFTSKTYIPKICFDNLSSYYHSAFKIDLKKLKKLL